CEGNWPTEAPPPAAPPTRSPGPSRIRLPPLRRRVGPTTPPRTASKDGRAARVASSAEQSTSKPSRALGLSASEAPKHFDPEPTRDGQRHDPGAQRSASAGGMARNQEGIDPLGQQDERGHPEGRRSDRGFESGGKELRAPRPSAAEPDIRGCAKDTHDPRGSAIDDGLGEVMLRGSLLARGCAGRVLEQLPTATRRV